MEQQDDGWTTVGKSGASQDPEQYEPRRPTEESAQNPFSQLGETDDPSTTIDDAQNAAVEKADEKAEDLKDGAKNFADQATGTLEDTSSKTGDKAGEFGQEAEDVAGQAKETVKDTANKAGEKASELVNGASNSGFGTAGKDEDVKAPVAGVDAGLPEEYGAADDEFVTRTNYPPSEPEAEGKSFFESAKAFVAGAANPEETGAGTLVDLKNKLAHG